MSTIKVNNIVPNSGTHVSGAFSGTFSGSILSTRLDDLEAFSSSLDAAFATDSELTSLSASFADRIDNVGGGTATDITALNEFTASAATTGSNTFIGNQTISGSLFLSGSANSNLVITDAPLVSLSSTAYSNTIIGVGAGTAISTGDGNVFLGKDSGIRNSSGGSNTFIGTVSGYYTVGSSQNSFVGYQSGEYNQADDNTSLGYRALRNNVSGIGNVSIGSRSGERSRSGGENGSASASIFIGNDARPNASSENNQIVIGANTVGNGSNSVLIGNTSIISTTLRGSVTASVFTGSFVGDGSGLTGIPGVTPIETGSFATIGSNVFTGSQYVSGGLFVQEYSNFGKSGIVKAADFKNAISVTGSVTTQQNVIGGFVGNFYNQWDSFGSQGGDGTANVGYFVGNENADRKLRLTSDADIQLNHGNSGKKIQIPRTAFGESKLELSGSFAFSSSVSQDWYVPQINLLTKQTGVLSMGTYSSTIGGYFNFDIYNFGSESEGTWIQNSQRIKLMTPNLQLSAGNGDPGIINVIGKLNVTGSMGISGSIIPAIGSSATSSFSLGSSTAAWKDIWVSQGTIHFLDGAGISQGTLSTTANGIQSDGDIYVNSNVRVGKGPGNNGLNTVFGMGALQSNTSGSSNTAFGGSALSSNTTGNLNTAIGGSTLAFNTTGYYNTAVGQGASYTNNGIANTAVGVRAGNGSIDANNSTVMGYEALRNVTTGDGNMAIGYQAGFYASGSSNQNVYLGYQAGPTASIEENSKLYIDFQQTDKPLIGGDFVQREVTVNGMLNVTTFLTLPPQNPLPVNPSPTLGSMAVSGSALYFYNGSAWKEVSLVP